MAQKFIATKPIFEGRFRVANPGDPIPESHPKFEEWKKAKLVEAVKDAPVKDAAAK